MHRAFENGEVTPHFPITSEYGWCIRFDYDLTIRNRFLEKKSPKWWTKQLLQELPIRVCIKTFLFIRDGRSGTEVCGTGQISCTPRTGLAEHSLISPRPFLAHGPTWVHGEPPKPNTDNLNSLPMIYRTRSLLKFHSPSVCVLQL